jgi:TRAP transporter 4TM/12TM fusion protein
MDRKKLVTIILSIAFVAFQIYIVSGLGFVGIVPQRIIHLSFALALAFLHRPLKSWGVVGQVLDALFVAFSAFVPLYVAQNHFRIETRFPFVDRLTTADMVIGILILICALEATRRIVGTGLVVIATVFGIYAFAGPYLPGLLGHGGITLERFIDNNFLSGIGLFGMPIGVSVTYVFYFVLFGAALEACGAGQLLIDLAMIVTGRTTGGPAKTAIVSSALLGSVTGSAAANVAATGVVTIPLMKRVGYAPAFAGAVEAVASTGGQLIPPVMGAAAFVMAEMIGVPYLTICKAAILPAALYCLSLFFAVDFEARRLGLKGLSAEEVQECKLRAKSRWYLVVPLIVLVYYIATGRSLMTAAIRATIVALVTSLFNKETRLSLNGIIGMIVAAARGAAIVAIPCAAAGIIVGSVTVTGLGLKFTDLLLAIAGGQVIPTIVLVAVACLILGMGMPTSSAYIMAAVLMGPALSHLGFASLQSHMFIFFFAIISMITPPVAVAAYTAAGIAGSSMSGTGWQAVRLAAPSFMFPVFYLLSPALLLQGSGGVVPVIREAVSGVACVAALAAALIGFGLRPLTRMERVILGVLGVIVVVPSTALSLACAAATAAILLRKPKAITGPA